MKVEIVAIGKSRDKRCQALFEEYLGRFSRYLPCEDTALRESKLGSSAPAEQVMRQEAEAFERAIPQHAVRVAMDERGDLISSQELARRMEQWMNRGERHVVFLIGGAHGLDPALRESCAHVLALSPMTFPHELARVLLAEQLYRAMTILRNEPYHK